MLKTVIHIDGGKVVVNTSCNHDNGCQDSHSQETLPHSDCSRDKRTSDLLAKPQNGDVEVHSEWRGADDVIVIQSEFSLISENQEVGIVSGDLCNSSVNSADSHSEAETLQQVIKENKCNFSSLERKILGEFSFSSAGYDTGYHSVKEVDINTIPIVRNPSVASYCNVTYPPLARCSMISLKNDNSALPINEKQRGEKQNINIDQERVSIKSTLSKSASWGEFQRSLSLSDRTMETLHRSLSHNDGLESFGLSRNVNNAAGHLSQLNLTNEKHVLSRETTLDNRGVIPSQLTAPVATSTIRSQYPDMAARPGQLRTWGNPVSPVGGGHLLPRAGLGVAHQRNTTEGTVSTVDQPGKRYTTFSNQCDATVTSGHVVGNNRIWKPTTPSDGMITKQVSNPILRHPPFPMSPPPSNDRKYLFSPLTSNAISQPHNVPSAMSSFKNLSSSSQRHTPVGAARSNSPIAVQISNESHSNIDRHTTPTAYSSSSSSSLSSSAQVQQRPRTSFYTAPVSAPPHHSMTSLSSSAFTERKPNHWTSSSGGSHETSTPPTATSPSAARLKYRRRNILNLPPAMMQPDQQKQRMVCDDPYGSGSSLSDETRSSGHASMSESHGSSCSPPADSLPRNRLHSPPMAVVPEASCSLSAREGQSGSTGVVRYVSGSSMNWQNGVTPHTRDPVSVSSVLPSKSCPSLPCINDDPGSAAVQEINSAVRQLSVRSDCSSGSCSVESYTSGSAPTRADSAGDSTTSSHSGCESEPPSTGPLSDTPARRLARHSSSQETINTNMTATAAADEFVWLDSHNRLVELQRVPWSVSDLTRVLQNGRLTPHANRIAAASEVLARLSHMLQRALVRVARETQRLSHSAFGTCTKQHVLSALRVILAPALSVSCTRACMRAGAMYAVTSGGDRVKQSKSSRAALQLSVGRFYRWMCDVRLARFIHDYSAVYLTAAVENLFEEVVLLSLSDSSTEPLSVPVLDQCVAANVELWGLFQPHAHLNSGRTSSGVLALPRFWPLASTSLSDRSLDDSIIGVSLHSKRAALTSPSKSSSSRLISSCHDQTDSGHSTASTDSSKTGNLDQTLLTTCVGSLDQLLRLVTAVTHFLHQRLQQAESAVMGTSVTSGVGTNASTSSSSKNSTRAPNWSSDAISTLFYFTRCSQLEHVQCAAGSTMAPSDGHYFSSGGGDAGESGYSPPVQQLVFERPYIVLPPLIEWVRVSVAHVQHRRATIVDSNDVMQAARLLLPGVDCAPRHCWYEDGTHAFSDIANTHHYRVHMAFRLLESGRPEVLSQALNLLPVSKTQLSVNERNSAGVTMLMMCSSRGDSRMAVALLDAGAAIDAETPCLSSSAQATAALASYPSASSERQMWTALTFATAAGHADTVRLLLERGARVEGGAREDEERCTETPLQIAAASGNVELVSLLLRNGADPFLSTLPKDSLCYSAALQKGCHSALSVAAAHGQRATLHRLLSQPLPSSAPKVLSLAEMLAEGESGQRRREIRHTDRLKVVPVDVEDPRTSSLSPSNTRGSQLSKLSRAQVKTLQEAMYHSAESQHLEMTLDLRNVGVPWTLYCWMCALSVAQETRLDCIVDQLLQDFLHVWPEEQSLQFVDLCLPLLFNIFRHSKNEGTSLLLADIFSSCYGRAPIPPVTSTGGAGGSGGTVGSGGSDTVSKATGPRIDVKYVNNAELSDAQFRVEGRVFYAHKIILVNASQRFRQMLSARLQDGSTPIVQINDIRYDIFQMVMEFLYHGDCDQLSVSQADVLELMAAANFFQLDTLLRHCEARCSQFVTLDNVVSMYIHAKVYSADHLLKYCQAFLLQNMVALLTYDDSVRRLMLGGRRLNNHDVVSALLSTLQTRCRQQENVSPSH